MGVTESKGTAPHPERWLPPDEILAATRQLDPQQRLGGWSHTSDGPDKSSFNRKTYGRLRINVLTYGRLRINILKKLFDAKSKNVRPFAYVIERKLSFTDRLLVCQDCSLGQVRAAILQDYPGVLQNRTLAFWVKCFNKWNAMKVSDKVGPPVRVDANELLEITSLPKSRIMEIVKLFDVAGFNRIVVEGKTFATFAKTKVVMVELLSAGVLLSKLIPSRAKQRFLFGLADNDDSRDLDEQEFARLIMFFFRGLGGAFGILSDEDTLPAKARISQISARRLQQLHAEGDAAMKARLVEAIKARQEALSQSTCACKTGLELQSPGGLELDRLQRLLDVRKDSLALPYSLTLERFCPKREGEGDDLGDFDPEWHLSYHSAVPMPEEIDEVPEGHMLQRWEVILARRIFAFCSEQRSFRISHSEVEAGLSHGVEPEAWKKLSVALEHTAEDHFRGRKPEFFRFLKAMCPSAQSRHLRLFASWNHFIASFDISEDGLIDKNEYLQMMCPRTYRLPSSNSAARAWFGELLRFEKESLRSSVDHTTLLFAEGHLSDVQAVSPMPRSLLPVVDQATWLQWNGLFDGLDLDHDNKVSLKELETAGILSPEVSEHLAHIIDPELSGEFTRQGFLEALLRAKGQRRAMQDLN
ncbi:unnamed protein product [Polarella glacialis]|uniref:Calmodulin n=2 Tax=Polarella glacialis TaxID=89957 RepID=A0A813KF78_POLGL|nr:unnamed protein product [Polarella glacialis]